MGGVISFCYRQCYVTETLSIKSPVIKTVSNFNKRTRHKVEICGEKSFSGNSQSGSVGLCEHVMLTASES